MGPGQYGWSGIVRGAVVVFFAYIGFDAVSTAAQEAKDPKRDMPIGILGSLAICTALYAGAGSSSPALFLMIGSTSLIQ
jgi:basic amino acid/polyamine antiporter, APA family